jgi:hypothetical protein
MKPNLALLVCFSVFLAPVTATAAGGIGSGLVLEAGFGCKMQQGKLVCGKTQGGGDKKSDNDGDHGKHKKKKAENSGLSECTIQQPGSDGGCKNGKWVCETLKSGKKCCGCAVDKSAKVPAPPPPAQQQQKAGSQEVPDAPADTLVLPYFETDLNKPGGDTLFDQQGKE